MQPCTVMEFVSIVENVFFDVCTAEHENDIFIRIYLLDLFILLPESSCYTGTTLSAVFFHL